MRLREKILELCSASVPIQNTGEPSSDRFIERRRPLLGRLFFFCAGIFHAFNNYLHEIGYWLAKHRENKLVDSHGVLA
jgi:hypothetical protein